MKNFKVFKEPEGYRFYFDDDNLMERSYDSLPSEIETHVLAIENWCNTQKTDEEIEIEKALERQKIAFTFIKNNATDEEKLSLIDIFPQWEVNKDYQQNDEFQYENNIYRVLQNHQSQAYWLPSESPSLYVNINNKVSIQDFVQPTGGHDAYQIGDEVIFEGFIYQSIIDGNVWSPSDYPQGWQKGANA